jgi:hypothetical protein
MATIERDNANASEEPTSAAPRNVLRRGDQPLFTTRHRRAERALFGSKRNEDGSDTATLGAGNGWMSGGKGKAMNLGEAFQRTEENGDFKPRPRPAMREETISESRIPRTKHFSPGSVPGSSPNPTKRDNGYNSRRREGRASSVPVDYDSEETGTRVGSPSPGPRARQRSKEESGSDGSITNLVEDPTNDDFDRKMSRFARDQERVQSALSSQQNIFSRADVGPRIAETTRALARKTSESSLDGEPPIRVPKTWGSKAKKNSDWMQKILSPDTSLEIKDLLEEVERPKTAPDVPLESVEGRSSMQELTPPTSRPASAQPNNASPEKSKIWDADLDFTAQSLQISTSPQLRVKSTKLEEIRSREIKGLTARAVATNRLEEIRERNSEERSFDSEAIQPQGNGLPGESAATLQEPYYERTILEEEGEHISDTPITIFSAESYGFRSESSSRERQPNFDRDGNSGHKREDAHEVLRRLSRAASSSPAPPAREDKGSSLPKASSTLQPGQKETKLSKSLHTNGKGGKNDEELSKVTSGSAITQETEDTSDKLLETGPKSSGLDLLTEIKRHSMASTGAKSDADPEERITAEAKLFDLPEDKSERNSIRAPSRSPSPSEDGQINETPRPKLDPLSLPTPRVTGAYIETPAPTVKRMKPRSISPSYEKIDSATTSGDLRLDRDIARSSSINPKRSGASAGSSQSKRPRSSQRPPLVNTAKPTTAAEDLRRIQLEAQIDDSTLLDFDALLEAEAAAPSDLNNTTILDPIIDLEYNERGLPLTRQEIERRIEKLTLDRMNQSLKNTSTSIRDARHGIERLEHQVSSSAPGKYTQEDQNLYIKLPIPRLWTSLPPENPGMKRRWKFTWLGFILSIFLAWYISESAMCAQFCHPTESRVSNWHPSDPFFPWAIPTKLDQWTGKVVSGSVNSLFGIEYPRTWSKVWSEILGPDWDRRYSVYNGPTARDWYGGRNGPVGIKKDEGSDGSMYGDEMI